MVQQSLLAAMVTLSCTCECRKMKSRTSRSSTSSGLMRAATAAPSRRSLAVAAATVAFLNWSGSDDGVAHGYTQSQPPRQRTRQLDSVGAGEGAFDGARADLEGDTGGNADIGSDKAASTSNLPSANFGATLIPSAAAVFAAGSGAGAGARGRSVRKHTGLSSSVLLPTKPSADFEVASEPSYDSFQIIASDASEITADSDEPPTSVGWKDRLLDVSNLASLLCVLDCTLLPLVSIVAPAISWMVGIFVGGSIASTATASSPIAASLASLTEVLGHSVALFFVLPVGVLTTATNYLFGHRQLRFAAPALLGLTLVYAANSASGVGIPLVDRALEAWGVASHACSSATATHACGSGWAHRLTNTAGCALLLGSNRLSRKYVEERNDGGCAASALAQAIGGEENSIGGRAMLACGPACDCGAEPKTNGAGGGADSFFQWESKGKKKRSNNVRNGGFIGLFSRLRP